MASVSLLKIDGLRRMRLHAEGQLVTGDAGGQFAVVGRRLLVPRFSSASRSSWLRCCSCVTPAGGDRLRMGSPWTRNCVPW